MESFGSYLRESASMLELERELMKIGYTKFKLKTRNTLLVYVPKSDRNLAMDDIAKKLGGIVDTSPVVMRKISSAGAVRLDKGKFAGFFVGVKPDLSAGLKTDEQETLAGIFIAAYTQNKKSIFSMGDLERAEHLVNSAHKISTLYPKAGKGWIQSSSTIAKTIGPYLSGQYEVHQRSKSKFVDNISKAAQTLIKQSGHKMLLDKWNPADIWLVKPKFASTNFKQFNDIVELNTWLLERFNNKEVIGVSLKQVGKSAKVQAFNKEARKPARYEGWDVGKTGFVNALNGTLYFDGGSMIIRNFGRPESVSGEINGKLAQGGKVGHGALKTIWKKYDSRFEVETHQSISSRYESDPDAVYNELFKYMKQLDPSSSVKDAMALKEIVEAKNNTLNYIISKLQVSQFIISLDKMTKEQQNDLIGALLAYAASSTEISSVFYKVS